MRVTRRALSTAIALALAPGGTGLGRAQVRDSAPAPAAPAAPTAPAASPTPSAAGDLTGARTRRVFPGAQPDGDAHWRLTREQALRIPGTRQERSIVIPGTRVSLSRALVVRAQGRRFDVLLWEGSRPEGSRDGGFMDEVAVLGVFPAGGTDPTDVAEVKSDRLTYFGAHPVLALGSGDDAFTLVNHHANAGQPYVDTALFHLREGRLRRIAQVLTMDEMSGCANAFREQLSWRTRAEGTGLPTVLATVELVRAPREFQESCGPRRAPERRERFEDAYRWDAVRDRYVRAAGTMGRLDRWNEARR